MNLGGRSSAGVQAHSQEAASYALCSENLGLHGSNEHRGKHEIYEKYSLKTTNGA